jgi:hypothetical protein
MIIAILTSKSKIKTITKATQRQIHLLPFWKFLPVFVQPVLLWCFYILWIMYTNFLMSADNSAHNSASLTLQITISKQYILTLNYFLLSIVILVANFYRFRVLEAFFFPSRYTSNWKKHINSICFPVLLKLWDKQTIVYTRKVRYLSDVFL